MVSYEEIIIKFKNFIADSLDIDKEEIFLFNQNTPVLPKTKEYVIIQMTGKNIVSLPVRDKDMLEQLSGLNFQIDFYGQNVSYEWATRLYVFLNAIEFNTVLRKDGLSVISCDAPINLTGLDFSDQYLERWSVSTSLEITETVELPVEYITGTSIKILGV